MYRKIRERSSDIQARGWFGRRKIWFGVKGEIFKVWFMLRGGI